MTLFVENPVPIAVVGGLLATMALIVFLSRRTGASLAALAAIVLVTVGLVGLERFLVSDREQVEAAVDGVMAAIEANDMPAVLKWVDPGSTVAADVQALMPLIKVEKARALGAVEATVSTGVPPTATTTCRAFLDGVHSSSGMRLGYFNQRVDVNWVKREDNWLIDGYTAYYEGTPIDAVSSARGNRPVSGR